jgi:LysM repeat protein
LKTNLLFLLPLCLITKFAFAQTYYPPNATKTDSILTYKDTLFLQADASGQLSLVHRLKRGQTLFQLSDFFKVSVEDLRKANPQFAKGTANAAGQTINIPVTKEHLKFFLSATPACTLSRKAKRNGLSHRQNLFGYAS